MGPRMRDQNGSPLCQHCKVAPIRWAQKPTGAWIALDRDSDPEGWIMLTSGGSKDAPQAVELSAIEAQAHRRDGQLLFSRHSMRCREQGTRRTGMSYLQKQKLEELLDRRGGRK